MRSFYHFKKAEFTYSLDPDEAALHKSPHLDLHSLLSRLNCQYD